jgi:hypothetical protein
LSSVVTDAELERLQQALKILSDAEKQLRLSSERSTWFTAALLQLGSGRDSETHSRSSSKQSARLPLIHCSLFVVQGIHWTTEQPVVTQVLMALLRYLPE